LKRPLTVLFIRVCCRRNCKPEKIRIKSLFSFCQDFFNASFISLKLECFVFW
jgi:hypothetical protein